MSLSYNNLIIDGIVPNNTINSNLFSSISLRDLHSLMSK